MGSTIDCGQIVSWQSCKNEDGKSSKNQKETSDAGNLLLCIYAEKVR